MMYRFFGLFFISALLACNPNIVETPSFCGKGSRQEVEEGRVFCVYEWPIVIETGFNCPAHFGNLQRFEPVFGACTGFGELKEIEIREIFNDIKKKKERFFPKPSAPAMNPIDILFVIDNSGSMCQEQDRLSEVFERFIEPLDSVDFQLGITTTHLKENHAPETVAQSGHLQSTPQPIPGFDPSCVNDVDDKGKIIEGSYGALKKRIQKAVDCMETPDGSFLGVSDAEINCAIKGQPVDCKIGVRCGGAKPKCKLADLFPDPKSYRKIDKILRSTDYQKEGGLDIDRISKDFLCASMVGTRGYGIEKGLGAAVLAVSPELAGKTKPNEGFIRKESSFGLVFVSDENDCTNDGILDEETNCGDAVCEYAIKKGEGLVPTRLLRTNLISNLENVKGKSIDPHEIFVGSLHARPTPLTGEPKTTCDMGDTGVKVACATKNGVAYSGSRYAEFISLFGDGGFALSNASIICQEDWSEYFVALGYFFRSRLK